MSNLENNINILVNTFHFSESDIRNSPTLVDLLDNFSGTITNNPYYSGAYYNPKNHQIILSSAYANLSTLAHELGHATGKFQPLGPTSYSSAKEYANARHKGEGEAIYYEVKVAQELGLKVHTDDTLWHDLKTQPEIEDNLTHILFLMAQYSGETLYEKIGELNKDMIPSGQIGTPLTYNESNHFYYLSSNLNVSSLAQDYQEALQKDLYSIDQDGNITALQPEEIKSLTNKALKHFNFEKDNDADEIVNTQEGGSAIAKQFNTYDLLYGANGNDRVVGNSGKDIILGGEGDDILMGMEGDDIVAGNAGNDRLYAGKTNSDNDAGSKNQLIGGLGQDHLHGALGDDTLLNGKGDFSDDNEIDFLSGGKGYDTYHAGNQDVILDEDGKGAVYVSDTISSKLQLSSLGNSILLTGGLLDKQKYPDEDVYIDAEEDIEYRLNGTTLTVDLIKDNKRLTIENYHKEEDSLGIRLNDALGKDNVFVIDITGSMGDNIALVKQNAITLIHKLFTNGGDKNLATNVGILTYQDGTLRWLDKYANTPEKAVSAINKIGAVSGKIEFVAASLEVALTYFPWRKGEAVSKQIWLYGDEPGDDLKGLEKVYKISHQLKVDLDGDKEGIEEYIPIHTISLHKDSDAVFKQIADKTKGVFFKHDVNTETALNDLANFGSNGDDQITGTHANNTINGQAGNDHLSGGLGSDVYLQTGNFGHDTIVETNPNNKDKNKIDFGDSSSKEYVFSNHDGHLFISKPDHSVTVENFYGDEHKIDKFSFNDMTLNHAMASFFGEHQLGKKVVYTDESYKAGLFGGKHFIVAGDNAIITGSGAEDAVVANGKNMNVHTGMGADKIYINGSGSFNAGAGNDIYYIGEDAETVTIHDAMGLNDQLILTNLALNDVFISKTNKNLQIQSLSNAKQVITIEGELGLIHKIEEITFSDGQTLHHKHLKKVIETYNDYSYDDVVQNTQLVSQIVDSLHQQSII